MTYTGDCPRCGEVRSTHPMQVSTATGAAGTHLGTRALALAAWLNKRLGLTNDCLASYENLPYTMQKCYAHHLKAIAQAHDRQRTGHLQQVRALLKAAMLLDVLRADLPPPAWARRRQHLEHRADELLSLPRPNAIDERVRHRLAKRRRWLFTFLDHAGVDATNNRAERSLRPAVIARKLSCGNKTRRGKRTWEILTSLAATCHQRGEDFATYLRPFLTLAPNIPAR